MKLSLHNHTAAPQGVHCVDGRARYVKPGETRELDVVDEADVRASAYLTVVPCEKLVINFGVKSPQAEQWLKDNSPARERQPEHPSPKPKPKAGKAAPDPKTARLRAEYTERAKKKPFGGWKADRLQAEIDKLPPA